MARVDDVAADIVRRAKGPIDTFKLQKIAYYSHAWHLAWEGKQLFSARIEAWANGPVVPALYSQHRGSFQIRSWTSGDASRLTDDERETIAAVWKHYGSMPGWELAELTHRERPWRDARRMAGLGPGDRGNVRITDEAMADYYGSLIGMDS